MSEASETLVDDVARIGRLAKALLGVVNAGNILAVMWESYLDYRKNFAVILDSNDKAAANPEVERTRQQWRDASAAFTAAVDEARESIPHVNAAVKRFIPSWPDLWTSELQQSLKDVRGFVRLGWGKRNGAWFTKQLTDALDRARQLESLDLTAGERTPRGGAAAARRKAGKDDGRKLTKAARMDIVRDWIKASPGGKWRGTLKELRAALHKDKGLDVSEGRLSEYLRGTSLHVKTHDTSRLARRHRKGGAEPVAQTESWNMPDDTN